MTKDTSLDSKQGLNIGIRAFDYERDLPDIKRIWQEVGWVTDDNEIAQIDHFFADGSALLGTIDDVAECSVHITPGEIYLGEQSLPLCAVTAVTTSRVARGFAFAQRLTARQLAAGAQAGAKVAALGMFDQGFYDKLGFGTGAYDHRHSFDPSTLLVTTKPRTPVRLSTDDFNEMHQAMCARAKVHGSVCIHPPRFMQAEFNWDENGFGLGYREGTELTHFLWLKPKGERGPYDVRCMIYRNSEQMFELLALLKSLADQVYSVRMMEPREIQLQVLLHRPFRNMSISDKSTHEAHHESFAWWQMRVLDVSGCVEALSSPVETNFTLKLTDPVEDLLDGQAWRGVSGTYDVSLGPNSTAHRVASAASDTPVLECSVNSFSRWLWGIRPASSLAITDDFKAPAALLAQLDQAIVHRDPYLGWDF